MLTIWDVLLCFCRLLEVRLQLGRELGLEHGWRGVSTANEALLVRLLSQLLFARRLLVCHMVAICMLLGALLVRFRRACRHPARPEIR